MSLKTKDVVFIASALDEEKALRRFLKQTKFNCYIVPNSQQVVGQFEVSVFPTHIIIDKQGEITATLTGGSENRHDDLRPLIERLTH